MNEEIVKARHINKYTCKRNKGEHEWEIPTTECRVRYIYQSDHGEMDCGSLEFFSARNNTYAGKEYKYKYAKIIVKVETRCKHCGKKEWAYLTHKIK